MIKSEIFPILDLRTQEKVKDTLVIGGKPFIETISLYFIQYYKLSYNIKTEEQIRRVLSVKSKPEYVSVRKWIGYFAYRTGKYTWAELSHYMGLVAPKGNGLNLICHQFQTELEVNRALKKEYDIHLVNLKELFITFTLARI